MPQPQSTERGPQRQISPERQALYYFGGVVAGVGLLMFLSVFVSAALHFGDFSDFDVRVRSMGLRAVGGMVMMIVGMAIATVGRAGAAGSGLKLDPEQARRDVEPWSRMTGGVVSDALDEAGVNLRGLGDHLGGDKSADNELPFDEKLRRLYKLREDGILSEEEYVREKQELLDKN